MWRPQRASAANLALLAVAALLVLPVVGSFTYPTECPQGSSACVGEFPPLAVVDCPVDGDDALLETPLGIRATRGCCWQSEMGCAGEPPALTDPDTPEVPPLLAPWYLYLRLGR